jgi:hypothetical protein
MKGTHGGGKLQKKVCEELLKMASQHGLKHHMFCDLTAFIFLGKDSAQGLGLTLGT